MTKCVTNHQKKKLKTIIISLLQWHHLYNSSGSAERRQSKESGLEFFHTPEPQRGLLSEAGVHVVVRDHHHLHPRCQCRLDTIGSVFKDQTLGKDRVEGMILSRKPIRSTGFQPTGRHHSAVSGKTIQENGNQRSQSHFSVMNLIFPQSYTFSSVRWDIHSIYNKQSGVPVATLHWICVLPKSEAVLFVIHIFLWCCTPFTN